MSHGGASVDVVELRVIARELQNRPHLSAMDDVAFNQNVLALVARVAGTLREMQGAEALLARAESYARTSHYELALAAIQGLLAAAGR
jgi:hypothetical protein